MDLFLIYQVKVAIIITAMFILYRLLLRRETFYRFNRMMLILVILLPFILPACNFTRYIEESSPLILISNRHIKSESIDIEITNSDPIIDNEDISKAKPSIISNSSLSTRLISSNKVPVWSIILFILYCTVFLFVLVKKTLSVVCVARIIKEGRYADRIEGCDVIESENIPQPFNWMKYIVMPKEWFLQNDASVWQHENLHAKKWHSIDLLLSDIATAVQWFNPVMLFLRKEFELLHEYEADRAVIESGADVRKYKLTLVNVVATSRGYSMANWLKQSNLKNRIDMMNRKKSNRWNMLKAMYIPVLTLFFLFANANLAYSKIKTYSYPQFEDGTVWIFQDGNAKVRTFDGVESNMNVKDVANYLKKYRGFKTKRMSLRYMYDIYDLEAVQPLAEQLKSVKIKIGVATDDNMLKNMNMPENRRARIYDEGGGIYRFELNGNRGKNNVFVQNMNLGINRQKLSISGDLNLMKRWIEMFDGHGIAIYPKNMSYTDVEQMAQAAWSEGIVQVSIVDRIERNITLIPFKSNYSKSYPGKDARYVAKKLNEEISSDYFSKGTHIENPKSIYNTNYQFNHITDVVVTPKELIIIFKSFQGSDLWLRGRSNNVILVNDKIYKQTKYEGLKGFEQEYFWSPDEGYYIQSLHFPAIPEGTTTVDLIDSKTNTLRIKGLQVSEDASIFENIKTKKLSVRDRLKTTHTNDDNMADFIVISRADFTNLETILYVDMQIFQPHSFLGHVSSDFTLTLDNGKVLSPIRVEGVPLDKDFDRNGDHVSTYFQLIFPVITEEEWNIGDPVLKGTICHEPLTFVLK